MSLTHTRWTDTGGKSCRGGSSNQRSRCGCDDWIAALSLGGYPVVTHSLPICYPMFPCIGSCIKVSQVRDLKHRLDPSLFFRGEWGLSNGKCMVMTVMMMMIHYNDTWYLTGFLNQPMLVGGLEHFLFSDMIIWNNDPNWLIFFRGFEITNQIYSAKLRQNYGTSEFLMG